MKADAPLRGFLLVLTVVFAAAGCSRKTVGPDVPPNAEAHVHHAPHGGTAVVLGDDAYHLELVLDPAAGKLQAYVLDGELENFVRVSVPSFEIIARLQNVPRTLVLAAVADEATGETFGDTSLFETQAEWLKATSTFEGTVTRITIRGTTFTDVKFNFPRGNE